jgi:hypothetical protein
MITQRDREIVRHIEKYNFATIDQIAKIVFGEHKCSYDIARRRLKRLIDSQYLRKFKNIDTNELIFTLPENPIKKVSQHSILVMDYYSELIKTGVEMIGFQREKSFQSGKVRSDAFINFKFNGFNYFQVLEVQLYNDKVDLQKYENIEIKQELYQLCSQKALPNIIVITYKPKALETDGYNVVSIDIELSDFPRIFI